MHATLRVCARVRVFYLCRMLTKPTLIVVKAGEVYTYLVYKVWPSSQNDFLECVHSLNLTLIVHWRVIAKDASPLSTLTPNEVHCSLTCDLLAAQHPTTFPHSPVVASDQ